MRLLLPLVLLLPSVAHGPLIPKSDYPKHATVAYRCNAPSILVDSSMGFDTTTGATFTHSKEQDAFHRVRGLLESSAGARVDQYIFLAQLSEYATPADAEAAYADFALTTTSLNQKGWRFTIVKQPAAAIGSPSVTKVRLPYTAINQDYTVIYAATAGPYEAEVGASWLSKHDTPFVTRYLARQFSVILRLLATVTSTAPPLWSCP